MSRMCQRVQRSESNDDAPEDFRLGIWLHSVVHLPSTVGSARCCDLTVFDRFRQNIQVKPTVNITIARANASRQSRISLSRGGFTISQVAIAVMRHIPRAITPAGKSDLRKSLQNVLFASTSDMTSSGPAN